MSLLIKLWDDTMAGPPPDKGLGKLRKQTNLSFRSLEPESVAAGEYPSMRVTRSIMIVKPETSLTDTPPTSPSPSGSVSPFSGSEAFRFRRRSASEAFEKASGIGSRSPRPPPYDL